MGGGWATKLNYNKQETILYAVQVVANPILIINITDLAQASLLFVQTDVKYKLDVTTLLVTTD